MKKNLAEYRTPALNVEEIFLKAVKETSISPTNSGKYYLKIDDNYRSQEVRRSFKTLKDAVKMARKMHSELREVSKHIYAAVKIRTMDINKIWCYPDDWTELYRIEDCKEYIKHCIAVDAIAELDSRTVDEVQSDICRYVEDYGVYTNSALASEKKTLPAKVNWQSVRVKQKEFKKAYQSGEFEMATELFETLKIFYRAYIETKKAA